MTSKKDIIEANRKYNEKNYDRITLNVSKGDRELIRQYVDETYPGLSVNQFIKAKIREEIPSLRWFCYSSVSSLDFFEEKGGRNWV